MKEVTTTKITKRIEEKKIIYRYEIQYSNIDDDTKVFLRTYPVVRETDHNYFIKLPSYTSFSGKLKQVKKNAYNTFAYDTKEKAMKHFIRRTKKRIKWFKYWEKECNKALQIIKEETEEA